MSRLQQIGGVQGSGGGLTRLGRIAGAEVAYVGQRRGADGEPGTGGGLNLDLTGASDGDRVQLVVRGGQLVVTFVTPPPAPQLIYDTQGYYQIINTPEIVGADGYFSYPDIPFYIDADGYIVWEV